MVYPSFSAPVGFVYPANQTNPNTRISCNQQVFPDAFSSPDLVHWTKHPRVLDTARVKWARRAIWAPAVTENNGKYCLVCCKCRAPISGKSYPTTARRRRRGQPPLGGRR